MAGKAVPMGRSRDREHPWLTITDGSWTWYVLKAYQTDPDAPYARWFCLVVTPMTGEWGDMGDTYVREVRGYVTQRDPSVPDEALPRHLRGQAARQVIRVGGMTIVDITGHGPLD